MKSWLQDNDIEMYSIHRDGKSVVAKRFIITLKHKSCKYTTSLSEKVYVEKLDDVVNEYNSEYHTTIKMTPIDVNSSTYIEFNKENNKKDPKFEVCDHVIISKYENIFAKGYTPNWSKDVFVKFL